MAKVQFLTGTGRSGREASIDANLIQTLPRARLLVPTGHYARRRTEAIVRRWDMPGLWGRPIQTFQNFVNDILSAGHLDVKPVSLAEQRLLLEQVVANLAAADKLHAIGAAAETEGFITHMLRVIRQLKQGAVEPAEFREKVAKRSHPSELDPVVADVYEAYQHALVASRVYDQEGLYWEASLLCDKGGAIPALDNVDVLLFDGFDEFTPAQYRLLKKLEPHVAWMIFGIAYDAHYPSAADLYSVPIWTLGKIEEAFEHGAIDHAPEEPVTTLSEYTARELFWRDAPPSPDGLRKNVRLVPCTTAVQEVESIARRIKHLVLDDGVAPEDIAVVYRSLTGVQDIVRSVFAECGIPVRMSEGVSLDQTSVGAFVLALFDAWAGWERDAVTDVLRSPWLHGGARDAGHYVDAVCRAAYVIRGRHEWKKRLAGLTARVAHVEQAVRDEDGEVRRRPPLGPVADPEKACRIVQEGLSRLADFDDAVKAEGQQREFAQRLHGIVTKLQLDTALEAMPDDVRAREEPALAVLWGLLDDAETGLGAAWADTIDRDEFVRRLRQVMRDTEVRVKQPRRGVTILSAEAARHLRFGHVFFAALNEGIVPQRPALNAVYSDDDLRDLVAARINLERQQYRTDYEMLLFHRVVEAPTDTLWLSYRSLGADGKALLPSPYLSDLMALLGEHLVEEPAPLVHDAAPTPGEAASWRDVRNSVFALDSRAAMAFGNRFERELHGVAVEQQRQRAAACDRYDGVLADEAMRTAVAEVYGDERVFSVSQIETYLSCPFRFFMERLLKVEEPELAEEEFDPITRGAAYHEILERFHRTLEGRALQTLDEEERAKAADLLDTLSQDVVERRGRELDHLPDSLIRLEAQRASAVMQRYLHVESNREKDAHWAPRHFEVSFGPVFGRGEDPLKSEAPFLLETPAGTVAFAGKIDRIDRFGNGVRLIDYKSSMPVSNKEIVEGRSIQLSLYALAFEQLLDPDSGAEEAWFLQIGRKNRVEALKRSDKKCPWDERKTILREAVAAAVTGIRHGQFHPVLGEDACLYCPGRKACRHDAARMIRKAEAVTPEDGG